MTSGLSYAGYSNVGENHSGTFGASVVYPFEFPKLAFGDQVTGATFTFNLGTNIAGTTFNADLYSLGVSTSNAVSTSDYFNGSFGTDPNATALQAAVLTSATRTGLQTVTNSSLATDINKAYLNGDAAGNFYFLRLSPSFTGTPVNASAGWNVSLTTDTPSHWPTLTLTTSHPVQTGRVLWEYWANLDGNGTLADLTNPSINPNYPAKPSGREYPTVLEIPYGLDQKSGDRMRCYFYPQVTGSYTFAVASNAASQLLFSMDGNPADASVIASLNGTSLYQQWNKYASQMGTVYLTAGQKYYMEAQHKSAQQTSLMSIGWQAPGASSITLMPATNCAPYDTAPAYTSGAIANASQPLAHPRLMISPAEIARLANAVTTGTTQFSAAESNTWQSIYELVTNTTTSGTTLSSPANVNGMTSPLIGSALVNPGYNPAHGSYNTDANILQPKIYYLCMYYALQSRLKPTDSNLPLALNQIYAELQAAANWGASQSYPAGTIHGNWAKQQTLDLPIVTVSYAVAYDWCYAGWTTAQRQFLVTTISALSCSWGLQNQPSNGGIIGPDNWQIVINSGVMLGAMAILGDEPTYLSTALYPTVLQYAPSGATANAPYLADDLMPQLPTIAAFKQIGPDGGWSEGPGYWQFITGYLTPFLSSMETAAGTDFAIDQLPGMSSLGSFPLYVNGPAVATTTSGPQHYPYQYADMSSGWTGGGGVLDPGLQYLSLKYNQPHYAYPENQSPVVLDHFPHQHPLDLIWYNPLGTPITDLSVPPSTYYSTAGTIFLQSASLNPSPAGANAWTDQNALYLGMKSGFNALDGGTYASPGIYGNIYGHSDMELGGFVFDALGIQWAQDLGRDSYAFAGYFDEKPSDTVNRWQYYRKRAEGNNTLVINPSPDGGQNLSAIAPVIDFACTPTTQLAIIDLTTAYNETNGYPATTTASGGNVSAAGPVAVPISSAHRGARILQGVLQIQDEIISNSSTTLDLNWFMHTATTVGTPNGNSVILTSGTKSLLMTIQSPAGAVFKRMINAGPLPGSPDPAVQELSPPNTYTEPTPKVWIELTIPTGAQTTTLTVSMAPYVTGNTPPTPPAVTPLANW